MYKHLLVFLLVGMTGTVWAHPNRPFSYNYAELGYSYKQTTKNPKLKHNAAFLNGSVEFGQNLFFFAGVEQGKFKEISKSETSVYTLGLGAAAPIKDNIDFFYQAAYLKDVTKDARGKERDDGWDLGVGLRTMFNPKFELEAQGHLWRIYNQKSAKIDLTARTHLSKNFAIGVGVAHHRITKKRGTNEAKVSLRASW